MTTVPEKVAQRLEELSLELGCNELLGLAEELSQWNPPPPSVAPPDIPRERQAQRMLEQIAVMLQREGYRVNEPRYSEEMMQRESMYLRMAEQFPARNAPSHLFFTGP